ncbi:MAG TPA: Stp1/IreP family PP2C-type Ser/Thr phosphatase [Nitrospirota bacterium]|nr:Stp1/IreP family PP2C-type Ser/Thr phosphatase [Nitrospirota bacterium]
MSRIISFGKSDAGLRRSNNEDALVLKPEWGLFAVADGMGGAASGEVASGIFSDTALEVFSGMSKRSEEETVEFVQKTFQLAHERILSSSQKNPEQKGMGCTAELIAFYDTNYVMGHVGDSRTYLHRQGQLRQITKDHSLVQEQVDQGIISSHEVRTHSLKHVILRAVGIEETLALDIIKGKCLDGDIFLLCSDGLTDMVEDSVIQQTLALSLNLDQKVEKLIDFAKSAGGRDNITIILCEIMP